MQRLTDTHSPGQTLAALRHLIIRLRSREQTRALVEELTASRNALKAADEAWEQARGERVAASAELEYLDERLGASVMQVSRQALALVEGNTADPRYRTLFPIAPSTALAPIAGDTQGRFVASLIEHLEQDDTFADLRAHAATLRERAEAVDAAVAAREGLYVAEAKASTARAIATDDARRAYNLTYPRLQLTFPDDDRLVESFFLRLRRSGSGGGEEPEG